jgi:chromosome segregation ATPase
MALRSETRAYDLSLEKFDRYLRDKRSELERCIQEVEEIQTRLQAEFRRELLVWQELFGKSYPQVATRREELPAAFRQYLDAIEAEELAKLEQEMASLEVQLAEGREKVDAGVADAQDAVRALREANPSLNKREERLKRQIAALQETYTEAYQELQAAREPFLGWLTNASAIASAKKRQREAKKKQAAAIENLRKVRQTWLSAVQETSEKQSALREDWQQTSIETAERQARYDYVRNNLADLARQNGLQRALEEMTEAPAMTDELGDTLRELARHNAIRAEFEEGLAATSESLGLLKGIFTGLTRFGESVGKVVAEKRRYNLANITIRVPRQAAAINQTWEQLRQQARDEEQAVRAPLEFAAIARRYVIDRLTPAVIEQFFESMGEALNAGTRAWN